METRIAVLDAIQWSEDDNKDTSDIIQAYYKSYRSMNAIIDTIARQYFTSPNYVEYHLLAPIKYEQNKQIIASRIERIDFNGKQVLVIIKSFTAQWALDYLSAFSAALMHTNGIRAEFIDGAVTQVDLRLFTEELSKSPKRFYL